MKWRLACPVLYEVGEPPENTISLSDWRMFNLLNTAETPV
jgi:hypothetical protein